MTIILSVSQSNGSVWAAGPEGLYRYIDGALQAVPQPQENLYCCCAIHDRVLVGGLPHGVAFSLKQGEEWQAGWMDNVEAPVVTLAADPRVETTGVILAGTDGGGLLRTSNRGNHWFSSNFGLRSFTVLAVTWAPPAPASVWPRWEVAFAGTEEGVYHSPNGGRGWKRAVCPEAVFQVIAVDPDFHRTGVVLAGTEGEGLYRSVDGGHSFTAVPDAPTQINALVATRLRGLPGWLLSDESGLWSSPDGLTWTATPSLEGSRSPALALLPSQAGVLAGLESGLAIVA